MEIKRIKGIGQKKSEALESIGISDTSDLLTHFPLAYQDRSHLIRIAEAVPGRDCYLEVTVLSIREICGMKRRLK